MPQLDPTWFASQIFWLVLSFIALYFMLSRLVLPPILDVIARREQAVANDLDQAQSLKLQAENARVEYDRMHAQARENAQQLISDALAQDKQRAEKAGRDMDAQIEKKLAEATQKITAKKQELMKALAPSTTELAALIVQKLTQREPNKERIDAIINDLVKGNR